MSKQVTDAPSPPAPPRPFFETLRELRNGAALEECASKLQELVGAVKESGKGGSLTLKINIRPAARGDATTVMLDDEVTIKKPARDRATTIMFTGEDNSLSRKDPRQQEFKLREVAEDAREARTVS